MGTWKYNDGGREAAGFKGNTGDCVTRAIAIFTGRPYREIYAELNAAIKAYNNAPGRRKKIKSSARTGISDKIWKPYLNALGYKWNPVMGIGTGTRMHVCPEELPKGIILVRASRHLIACIDGIAQDTYDSTREGTRCVYGYYSKPEEE